MARILRLENPSHKAVGPYLNGVAYEFPDTPAAQAEADRLVHVKGLTEIEASAFGPKDKLVDVDVRWIPALKTEEET